MTLRFAANLSILWTDRPFAERFERAAAAGFDTVELWWPGLEAAEELPELTARNRLGLALLNFDGGDMAAGERGLANDPERHEQLRANIPAALRIAEACGCTRLNLLVGQQHDRATLEQQHGWAAGEVAWAADQAAPRGCEVLIEAINSFENGPYLLTTTAAAADFAQRVGRPNVRLQYDAYHMQRMEGNLTATIDTYWPLVSHIQIADAPGRNEPGTGEINYRYVLDHIERKGYDGFVGLEYRPSTGNADDSFGWLDTLGRPRGSRT
ncbi:MAG TPA: TIM barrel protein [Actinomycetota bacterium]